MYGFSIDRAKPLETEAERAAGRIYGAGLTIADGAIIPGGNNVMADAAAKAFTAEEIDRLHAGAARAVLCADIIMLRQAFAEISARQEARVSPEWEGAAQKQLLEKIYDAAQRLKAHGWQPESEPHRMRGPRPV
jgi:hypothetical protein